MPLSITQISVEKVADLSGLGTSVPDGATLILGGKTSFDDGKWGLAKWDPNSTATVDDFYVMKQASVGSNPGRFLRFSKGADWNETDNEKMSYIANKPTIPSVLRSTSALTLSLVGTGATGTQISDTNPSTVRLSVSVSTTSTISGPATSVVVLKKCATNSATEGDWTSVATLEIDQTITLAIVLQSVQVVKGQLCCDLDAGWFVKLVNSGTGTHTEAFVSGEKTIYG